MGIEQTNELLDLGNLVQETKRRLQDFNYDEVQLNEDFKRAFSKSVETSGNKLQFGKTTALITNSAGQKIYAPNQWFVLAAYAVPLAREVMKYRTIIENFLDRRIDELKTLQGNRIKEKKDVYQLLRAGEDEEPIKSTVLDHLKKIFIEEFEREGIDSSKAEENMELLIRFMTESKWWLGGKGIERSNDYYVSPILGVLNLVNASQSYVATITYLYITDKNLANAVDMLTEIEVNEENPEERNKRLFRYWMEMQVKPEGDSDEGSPYSPSSIDQYISNIDNTPLPTMQEKSLFYTSDAHDVELTIEILDNSDKKNNTQRSAVRKYLQYLLEVQRQDYEDVFNHGLFGIHIKEKNDALSEDHPHICIGWSDMGDLSGIQSKDDLVVLYDEHYSKGNRGKGQDIGQVWRFVHDMNVGDYVIFAESSVFHIGRIESDYYYDNSDNPNQSKDYTNTRKVKWLKKNISRSVLSENIHNSLKTAMSVWTLNDYKSAVVDILSGTYRKDEIVDMEDEFVELVYNTSVSRPYDRNRIIFGAPGTGKSYGLKEDSAKLLGEDNKDAYERVTFHPDYSYSQFVGAYKPVTDIDGNIRYDFVPGPFMRVYVEALRSGRTSNPKPHLLLIEEINRAKVAAVFGDVFQLLDRDDNGVSEYEIQASEDVRKYLAKNLGGCADDYKKIRIPNNMFIWATMNSADQGVFPMDTAFKRRWSFEYLGINDGEEKMSDGTVTLGKGTHSYLVSWNQFRKTINDILAVDYKVNEDKLMGPFFLAKGVTESDEEGKMINTEKFIKAVKSKVIMYLYEDAAKQYRHRLFAGCDNSKYSSVCDAFDEIGVEIFGDTFKERYSQQKG